MFWIVCCYVVGLYTKVLSRRSFLIIWMHVSELTTRRLNGCAIITIKGLLNLFTVCFRSAAMSRNSRYNTATYVNELHGFKT